MNATRATGQNNSISGVDIPVDDDMYAGAYALQVEPARFKAEDQAMIDYQEALRIQAARDRFFAEIRRLLGEPRKGL
jgi:hypothetical protein